MADNTLPDHEQLETEFQQKQRMFNRLPQHQKDHLTGALLETVPLDRFLLAFDRACAYDPPDYAK